MFYDNFKRVCEIREVSEVQALKLCDFSSPSQVLQKWRSGAVPSVSSIIKLSQGLEVSCDFLLLGHEFSIDDSDDCSDEDYKTFYFFRKLSNHHKDLVRERIMTLLDETDYIHN